MASHPTEPPNAEQVPSGMGLAGWELEARQSMRGMTPCDRASVAYDDSLLGLQKFLAMERQMAAQQGRTVSFAEIFRSDMDAKTYRLESQGFRCWFTCEAGEWGEVRLFARK